MNSKLVQPKVDVAIVGGGLGGLALATGLLKRGYNFRLYEASRQLRTETGTSISLGGNAFTALERLHPETVTAVKACGIQRSGVTQHTKLSKDAPMITKTMPPFAGTYSIRWSEVQRVLATFVPFDLIEVNHKAVGFTEKEDCVILHFKDQPDVAARLVVAADGLRSGLRAAMVPNDPGPKFLGEMNWSSVLIGPPEELRNEVGAGRLVAYQNNEDWNASSLQVVVGDCGGGNLLWQVRMSCGDKPVFTDAERGIGGLGVPGVKERIIGIMRDAGLDLPLRAVQATPEADIFERASLARIPLDELGARMVSPGGRVVLVGDAAHGMHSSPGQGARTAFEDVHTIVELLDRERARLHGWNASHSHANGTAQNGVSNDGLNNGSAADGLAAQFSKASVAVATSEPSDLEALKVVLSEYEDLRFERMCTLQRFADEGCGSPALREKAKPPGITLEDTMPRVMELYKWLNQYPDKPKGDPDSKYWKPKPAAKAA